ncbi:hypothetical protein SKAU_G00202760 [Synaphobranchus kaupii]|uniref:Uncharacterized protein n=1 Tax=Synaphobranchus kaupii TaxID=118154 RepID=A0A9Q1FG44_SYNKA|nr:hypothetical protein SKAU_G00202760 [Synaphobranchus kaupii]
MERSPRGNCRFDLIESPPYQPALGSTVPFLDQDCCRALTCKDLLLFLLCGLFLCEHSEPWFKGGVPALQLKLSSTVPHGTLGK